MVITTAVRPAGYLSDLQVHHDPARARLVPCRESQFCSIWYSVTCPFPGRGSDLLRKLVVCVCIEHSKQQEGWRVIRQVTKETKPPAAPKPDSADWGGDDDWGDDEDEQVNWMAKKVEVGHRTLLTPSEHALLQ